MSSLQPDFTAFNSARDIRIKQQVSNKLDQLISSMGLDSNAISNYSLEQAENLLKQLQESIDDPTTLYYMIAQPLNLMGRGLDETETASVRANLQTKKVELLNHIGTIKNDQIFADLKSAINATSGIGQIDIDSLERQIEISQAEVQGNSLETLTARKEQWESEQKALESQRAHEINTKRVAIEAAESKAKIWQKFLERESVASISGAILLFVLILLIGLTKIWNVAMPDILGNVLLVIVGFFFGQSVKNTGSKD